MKYKNKTTKLKTNSSAKSVSFDISKDDPDVIIDILRNKIYAFPIRTLVQEYISNARDANRESKTRQNFKVYCPTKQSPLFRVRDFGNGISPKMIKKIFVLYGASTKRDSNLMTGGFGLGSKSAWSYTDNFTVISYTNGTKRTYLAHVGKSIKGHLDLLSTEKTKEPNGIEIVIGVKEKDFEEFHKSIARVTFFWKQRPKVFNLGRDHYFNPADFTWWRKTYPKYKLGNVQFFRGWDLGYSHKYCDLFAYKDLHPSGNKDYSLGLILLIDEIPYPIKKDFKIPIVSSFFEMTNHGVLSVISLKNGELDLAVSREEIQETEDNKKTINEILTKIAKEIYQDQIDKYKNVKTFNEYKEVSINLHKYFCSPDHIKFKGVHDNYSIDHQNILSAEKLMDYPHQEIKKNHFARTSDSHASNMELDIEKNPEKISINHAIFVFEDQIEGKNKTRGKFKKIIFEKKVDTDLNTSKIIFFEQNKSKHFISIMKEIGAIPLSELPRLEKNPEHKEKTQTKQNKIFSRLIQVPNSLKASKDDSHNFKPVFEKKITKTSKILDLGNIEQPTIFIEQIRSDFIANLKAASFNLNEKDLRELSLFFLNNGMLFCAIAPSYIKRINNHTKLKSLSDYLDGISDEEIQTNRTQCLISFIGAERLKLIHPLLKHLKIQDIQDSVLKKGFSLLSELTVPNTDNGEVLPQIVMNQYLKNDKIMKEHLILKDLFYALTHKYPLFSMVKVNDLTLEKVAKDLVMYFNSKAKELNLC